jgi:hypothetical protein
MTCHKLLDKIISCLKVCDIELVTKTTCHKLYRVSDKKEMSQTFRQEGGNPRLMTREAQ